MERHAETRPEGWGWACLMIGLYWLGWDIKETVLSPGIGSSAFWTRIVIAVVISLVLVATLLVLRSIPLVERDKRRKIVRGVSLASLVMIAVSLVLSYVPAASNMSDFFGDASSMLIGGVFLLFGIELFLEEPRGQNPGWLYFMVGWFALMQGVIEYIRAVGMAHAILWTGAVVVAGISLYLVAVTLILKYSSDLYRGRRRGCGNLMALLAYKTFGMLLLAFYFCVMLVFFGLSFAATTPEMSRFCLYTGWMLLGAGAVWLGVSRIRHWDWI